MVSLPWVGVAINPKAIDDQLERCLVQSDSETVSGFFESSAFHISSDCNTTILFYIPKKFIHVAISMCV